MRPVAESVAGSRQTLVVLKVLRVSLHVMFAFLLGLGAVLALGRSGGAVAAGVACLGLALAAVYVGGTVYEVRRGVPAGYGAGGSWRRLVPSPARVWLAVITSLWVGLMSLDTAFTWTVFPVMFLYLHLLRPLPGVLATILLCTLAVGLPLVGPAGLGLEQVRAVGVSPGMVIGPLMGALLAIVISFTYRALRQDATAQYQLAQRLRALQAELTHQQYSAGKLAERERLAREIHDTLAQGLSSIVLVSRAAASSLSVGNVEAAAQQVDIIQSSATANLAEARRFIRDLSSPALNDSLPVALEALARTTQDTQRALSPTAADPFVVTFTLEGEERIAGNLPADVSATLLRVAQGALANATAHSGASRVALTLSVWPGEVTLDIFDNGRGFVPPAGGTSPATDDSGYGLPSLRARLAQVGGRLSIESTPASPGHPGSTVLSAQIPLSDLQEGR